MKNRLVLIINKNIINLVLSIDNIPVSTKRIKFRYISDLKSFIKNFMIENNIKNDEIKDILLVIDFTSLLKTIKKDSFAYIQMGRVKNTTYINTIESFCGIDLNIFNLNIINYNSKKDEKYILNFLEYISKMGIDKIAINNSFSSFNKSMEKKLIKSIESNYPSYFKICPSYIYNNSNYIIRRNMLFLDLILSDTITKFIKDILKIFNELGLYCNIYFMKGNGTITNLNFALACPCCTWQCIFASNLIGAGVVTGKENSFILTDEDNTLYIGILQNKMPVFSTNFNYLDNLAMPQCFPKKICYDKIDALDNLKSILDEHNIFAGQIPVISFIDSIKSYSIHPYKLIKIQNNPSIIATGALNAPFELKISSNIKDMNFNAINKTKKEMKIKADKILKNNDINLKDIKYNYNIIPVKYNLQSSSIIHLSVNGDII